MEVVQGKSTNKKVVIAQEIAFAKVLAGNNKTLRDRAIKKLTKWLRVRGNGKWAFTEEEFIRIWTGLFYCMWMSDKFLVQEELAESISHLIHCFKKNSENALLFVKCFNKRILMEWDGLDQYRIDKFNMLSRRFLRQTFVYCKEKNWDELLLNKLMQIFFGVVLHRDNSLGFVLHFISIYAEELAKVSKGKLQKETVLTVVEPFIKVIARTKEERIRKEAVELFTYLMRQTDTGIEFEEQFNAWRQQGFPGSGPKSMKRVETFNGNSMENGDDSASDEEDDGEVGSEPLDPRAGSVHVFLPQIPLDIEALIDLFKKHEQSKQSNLRGKRALRDLCQKYSVLKKGRFPARIKKDKVLDEKLKKKNRTVKNAKELLKFTEGLDEGPIRTREFKDIEKELREDEEEDVDMNEEMEEEEAAESGDDLEIEEFEEEEEEEEKEEEEPRKSKPQVKKTGEALRPTEKNKGLNGMKESTKDTDVAHKENQEERKKKAPKAKKKKKKKERGERGTGREEVVALKKESLSGTPDKRKSLEKDSVPASVTPKKGTKRKILSNWQVQELDTSSPEYYKIETPKIIRIERKIEQTPDAEENEEPRQEEEEKASEVEEKAEPEILPAFWEKARAKVTKKSGKGKVFLNPFAEINGVSKSPGMRRISFALERNMAQENDDYLEEVKNSPSVPFDGSKRPVQSALKSGLAPSPVNPFHRFKKIKF